MDEPTDQMMDHYAEVARKARREADREAPTGACASPAGGPCCGDPLSDGEARFLYGEETLAGLPVGALVASRGCGDPVARAGLQPGERVLDLGSGGGIDALIAARLVGPEGSVWGLDMTAEMVDLASRNASAAGVGNVTFLEGSIEPKTVYTGEVLDEKARRKSLLPVLERTRDKNVDGLVGSAIFYGSVEEER